MTFFSFAQNFEDVRLHRCFGELPSGTYFDIGASEPTRHSNTYAFYRAGWSGVTVDPIPERHAEHLGLRPRDTAYHCALGAVTERRTLFRTAGRGGTSTLDSKRQAKLAGKNTQSIVEIELDVRTLADIQAETVSDREWYEFISIDVEGFEEEVVRGADFSKTRPKVMIIEAPRRAKPLDALLLEIGYHFVLHDEINRWYVHAEHSELGALIKKPISLLDNYSKLFSEVSSLRNRDHPDHVWALRIAEQVLRSDIPLDAERISNALLAKFETSASAQTITSQSCNRAYLDTLDRRATDQELEEMIASGLSIQECYRQLCETDEFKMRLGGAIAKV